MMNYPGCGGMCRDFKPPALMRIKSTSRARPPGGDTLLPGNRHPNAEKHSDPPLGAPRSTAAQPTLRATIPQRASAASSLTRASTQRAPSGVCSFFQNGAWVFR